MGVSDFSSPFPRCCFELRFLRSAVPHARVVFVFLVGSCALDARLAQASGLVAVRPPLRIREEATRSPRFLGCPSCTCPALRPRRSLGAHDRRALRYCLPRNQPRRPPRASAFRGSITRPMHSLSTLRGYGRPHAARKTRFRLVINLYRAARSFQNEIRRAPSESFCDVHPPRIASSFPRLVLAH